MYSVIVILIDPNDLKNRTSKTFEGINEIDAVKMADVYVTGVHKENPLLQANFSLQKRIWKDVPFSKESQEVLGK